MRTPTHIRYYYTLSRVNNNSTVERAKFYFIIQIQTIQTPHFIRNYII